MKIYDIFPETLEFCENNDFHFLIQDIDTKNAVSLNNVLDEIWCLQSYLIENSNITHFYTVSKLVLTELITFKKTLQLPSEITVFNYLQFIISVQPICYSSSTKNLNTAYDWSMYSLCDDLTDNQVKQVEPGRFYSFHSNPIISKIFNYPKAANWIASFYYMCRCLSACHEIAEDLMKWSVGVSIQTSSLGKLDDFCNSWSSMACWAANNQHPSIKDFVRCMEAVIAQDIYPEKVKSNFLMCLSTTVSQYSSRKSWEWAKKALRACDDQYVGHEKLQLLLGSINWGSDDLTENKTMILGEVRKIVLNNKMHSEHSKISSIILSDRLVDIITPFIGACIEYKEENFVYRLLVEWYDINDIHVIDHKNKLLIYPNHISSYKLIINGRGLVFDRDQSSLLESLMKIMNKFLGVSSSIGMLPDFELHQPNKGRFGVPSELESDKYEKALNEFYCIDIIRDYIEEYIDGFLLLPGHNHPIQYITNKYLSRTWPHSVSLEEPLQDRPIQRICLWSGAGSMTEEMEINAIRSIFIKKNISVEYYSSDMTTLEKFREIYQSEKFDVIWVMSHGEYNHWHVGDVKIAIGKDEFLSIDEVLDYKTPSLSSRRLLFLNVCDGATHAHMGGLSRAGFAPALSNRNQCTISHLWPVNPYVAALFGVVFAIMIRNDNSFFSSYEKTLSVFSKGNDEILSLLSQFDELSDIKERLLNQNIDCSLLAHAGSSAFFQ